MFLKLFSNFRKVLFLNGDHLVDDDDDDDETVGPLLLVVVYAVFV